MTNVDISRYIYVNAGYSVAGLAIGIVLGFILRDLILRRERKKGHDVPRTTDFRTNYRALLVGVILVVLSVLSVWQGIVYQTKLAESLQCQADFNNRFISVLSERTALAEQDRQNLQDLVQDTIAASGNPTATNLARQGFLDRKEQIDAVRRDAELPDPDGVDRCE